MKSTITLLLIFPFMSLFSWNTSPNNPELEKLWTQVETLQKKGQPRAALEIVEEIISMARDRDVRPHLIKGIQIKTNLIGKLEESGAIKGMDFLESQLADTPDEVKALLEATLAEKLKFYVQNHFYQLNNRTTVAGQRSDDKSSWSAADFENAANEHYLAALSYKNTLLDIPTKDYSLIVDEGKNTLHLTPTLYDFIGHQAIDHFTSSQSYSVEAVSEPIDWDAYLVDDTQFKSMSLPAATPMTKKHWALQQFQDVISSQQTRDPKDVLVYTDLKRLKFIHQQAKSDKKDQSYEVALHALLEKFSSVDEISLVHLALAQLYQSQANQEEEKTKAGDLRIKAHRQLTEGIAKKNNGYGVQECKNALASLEAPQLSLRIEKVIVPNQASLMRIDHKGLDQLNVRIGKISRSTFIRYQTDYKYRKNIKNILSNMDEVVDKNIKLTDNKNYTSYASEFVNKGLDNGIYFIYLENKNSKISSSQFFHVTNIGYARTGRDRSATDVIVFDRSTGQPLPGVMVMFYGRDRRPNTTFDAPIISGATNADGIYSLINGTSRSYYVEFKHGKDEFFPYENIYTGNYRTPRIYDEATILTDRAIYRPGQTVYFKTIAYQKNEKSVPHLLKNKKLIVEFVNPHGKVVERKELTTNEYGSVSGEFTAPEFGLNGQFYIRVAGMANHGIRIEEYKRPKFKVELNIPEGELTEGMTLEVPGLAKTFAGTALENAKVNYQVTRSKRYYHYWSWYGGGGRNQGGKLIAVGSTTTDADGGFNIAFKTLEAEPRTKYWSPIYVYEIVADVIDENGETRTGTTTIRIGAEPYYISTDISASVDADKFDRFTLKSENAMSKPAASWVNVRIVKLRQPAQPKVDRLWGEVDYLPNDKAAFEKNFPYLNFENNKSYENWVEDGEVYNEQMDVSGSKEITLPSKLTPAVYKIIVTNADGEEKHVNYFSAYSFNPVNFVTNEQFAAQLNKTTYQPGEEVELLLHSAFKNSKVFVSIEKDNEIIRQEWKTLTNTTSITVPVEEQDRGGFVIRLLHVVHNRMLTSQFNIDVPWANKKLDITWETFRDKLLPGEKEVWKLKITGPDKEAVAAELVAGMYDASLDEFVPFDWTMSLYPRYTSYGNLSVGGYGLIQGNGRFDGQYNYGSEFQRVFPYWRYLGHRSFGNRSYDAVTTGASPRMMKNMSAPEGAVMEESATMDMSADSDDSGVQPPSPSETSSEDVEVGKNFAPRTNLNETVFFMPHLMTDKNGDIVLEFTMNEALTSWKLQLLGHTTDLKYGLDKKEVVTQKDLMVFPQIPRFLREGDAVTVSAKINKLIESTIEGQSWIEIRDALNGKNLTAQLVENDRVDFRMENEKQLAVDYKLNIPQGYLRPLEIIIRAKAGKHTDGESNVIPVLTNQILVTETLPMTVRANQRKTYNFDALQNINASGVRPHRLTLEYMENPVWFAVQSMPYLTEYPHACTEQVAHKIYANSIASHIIKQYPKIQEIFRQWESKDELISNLNKNQELKSALIEETPWLREAESEEQQMKNIALLFDYDKMSANLNQQMDILFGRQLPSGAFPWFSGGRPNTYITQLVVEIFGHLDALGVEVPRMNEWRHTVERAIQYSHSQMKERYDKLPNVVKKENILDRTSLHAIYITSFFRDMNIDTDFPAWKYYYDNAKTKWVDQGIYQQALLATAFYRFEDVMLTKDIVASFKDRALRSEELGMYFKYHRGYYWYNQPVETQAHVMEAIALVDGTSDDLNEMRIWLLKNKQTNRWRSTVSTAKAIYALLLRGDDWLGATKPQFVTIGDEVLSDPNQLRAESTQAGTGYFKKSWTADEITSDMSTITIKNENEIVSWGAAYWQYFQAIDQVEKYNDNPLSVERSVFKKVRTSSGESLVSIDNEKLNIGDKVTVRLEIKVDRMMEFIHLKDLRAAGFEPVDVLSGYQWKGGLYYYQSTTDLGTHFFIDRIQQGTYVLEYDAFAVNAGDFSGGMSTLQCMYAPEFASHSEGRRVAVD